jgi:hypothetical protein
MEHGSAFRSLRKAPGDGARSTDQKSGVYRDDRIVHFDGDPEEFADGDTRRDSLRAFKTMDTSFVENLPEGTVVTDGVAVQCKNYHV